MDLLKKLKKHQTESKRKEEVITLADYIKLLKDNPDIHKTAHQRVLDMILSHGVERDEEGNIEKYNFFAKEIFGVEESIEEFMSYLRAAASGSEVGKRILLMYGPTSSGKSQISIMVKRGLEEYSKTEAGQVWALADSPMHEDPMVAIPNSIRSDVEEDLGITIDGQMSPAMSYILKEDYKSDFLKLKVKRIYFDEMERRGIGTFVPSDKKSQDISELVGSINLSKIAEYGTESHPMAYKFDGELNISNRGVMEFVEMLKVDQKFLYVLLTLAQEKNIKTGRFPLIYADEFLLSHTNETEYRRFLAKDEMEALHDRIIVVKVPYNLNFKDEVRIYEKLIGQTKLKDVHISPYSLHCAALFAILSRLKIPKNQGLSMLSKARLYAGEEVEGFTPKDVPALKKEFDAEGMDGVSPRYIINRISAALAEENVTCITPVDMIRAIRSGFVSNPKLDAKEIERLDDLLTLVIEEYSKIAKNEVQKAFFVNFEEEIEVLLANYLDHVEAFLEGAKVEDEWGDLHEPNERFMRSIEEKIKISQTGKASFRQEILRKMYKSAKQNDGKYNYKEHAKLKEALEKQLFDERQDIIRLTVSSTTKDEETLKKINVVIETLVDKYGYTVDSANKLLRYVSSVMARN